MDAIMVAYWIFPEEDFKAWKLLESSPLNTFEEYLEVLCESEQDCRLQGGTPVRVYFTVDEMVEALRFNKLKNGAGERLAVTRMKYKPPTGESIFGGLLRRIEKNKWQWADGSHELRVYDLYASQRFDLRCCDVKGETFVEVPLSTAMRERDVLGWVLSGYEQVQCAEHAGWLDERVGRQSLNLDGTPSNRAIPLVALVPAGEWDQWSDAHPYGAVWDTAIEADLFDKARQLGWTE